MLSPFFLLSHDEVKQKNSYLNGVITVCVLLSGIVFIVSTIHIVHIQKRGRFTGILQSNQRIDTICTDYIEAKVERYCRILHTNPLQILY